ncbi:MAG TPA: type II toxin-antitoxin system prevent-host-death family antitoxin [Steroidobacteraceae bacterium]|nr:type II toxin-antitoxin system prevent-host-death family antitoxin [Steroidobacteraceae bacterium]
MQVNIYDAKAQLSALLDRALAGEEVVIARAGKPLARLTPLANGRARSGVRLGGLGREASRIDPAFHAPLSDRDLLGR